ncbi:SGNH/GDSL hydrolase family protein [Bradyrhizobium genosp. P]|uniref:SGNH/GDSL hydrolase family protein n=1 Tax=Bradyrhizobium genosp. P TaxID=83641 RepID=UPI003CF48C70
MRKRFLVGMVVLIVAGLLFYMLDTPIAERREKAILQRIQEFVAQRSGAKPVVFVGDSLVEGASFSPTLCGRPVINAAYGGAVASGVLRLVEAFERIRFAPAVLVIAVGVNDSIRIDRRPFAETYPEIVRRAVALGGKVFVVSLAPVAASGVMADEIDRARFAEIDRVIRQAAREGTASLIDVGALPTKTSPVVPDGVHLSADGYAAWTATIESAINAQCP